MDKRLKGAVRFATLTASLAALALWLLVVGLSQAQGPTQKLNLDIEGMV